MYRQILLDADDRNYHLMLWRNDPSLPVDVFQMHRVSYGIASSCYHAVKTLQEIALRCEGLDHRVKRAILNDFYVDDLMTGAANEAEARDLMNGIIKVLGDAGFPIRKFPSNCAQLIQDLPVDLRENANAFDVLSPEHSTHAVKILGVRWVPSDDCFEFLVQHVGFTDDEVRIITKRQLLADILKLFDPVGWMSPVTLLLKAFMQSTWEQGLGWYEPLPKDTRDEFIEWRKHLVDLRKIRIPRCLLPKDTLKSVQFHVYCDASERGYSACVYIRAVNSEGTVSTRLIMAKAKVSPVKQISIPRLELLAATIGVKLVQIVTTAFDNAQCPFNEIFAYSDSTTVLAWLSRNSRVWVTFVSNRVSAILEVVQRSSWYHIPSEQNPADLLSRGCHPGELVGNNKWWYGPDAVQQKNFTTPNQDHLLPVDTSTDMKKETSHCFFANRANPESVPQFQDLKQTSNFEKTVRVTSYMIRFLSRMKRYSSQSTASNRNTMLCEYNKKFSACAQNHRYVTPQEATFVRNLFIQREQQLYLTDEIIALNAGKELHRSSKLFDLYPFMDEGIMRVGGRLAASNSLSDDQKLQIIVPHDSPLGWLLIDHAHRVLFHGTQQGCLAVIRAKYWLVKANPKIRKYIHDCTRCHRYFTSASVPLMGDLPQERVTECKPWDHTGVDFAGPFNVRVYSDPPRSILPKKARSTRGTAQGAKPTRVCSYGKTYMAIFVCFASKAVHIEAVGDLSTASCLAAFNRFVARRRKPRRMYSDNGTNFVCSRNEIDALQAALAKKAANSLPRHSAATGID